METKGLFSGKCEVCGKIFYADDLHGRSVFVPYIPFYPRTDYEEVIILEFEFECCGKEQRKSYDDSEYNEIMEKYIRKQRRCFEDRLRKELSKRIGYEGWYGCKDIIEKLNETFDDILEQ